MNRFLLDTHTLLWAVANPSRLSRNATQVIAASTNELVVSAASAWEIATKHRLGKMPGVERVLAEWDWVVEQLRAQSIPVTHRVALRAGSYVSRHRDPFDRLLAAEAELAGVGFITADSAFADFPVTVIW